MWLRYEEDGSTYDRSFWELEHYPEPDVERISGRTLRRIGYSHRLSKRTQHRVTIGADQLFVPAARAFMDAWWSAERVWCAFSESSTVPDDASFIEMLPMEGPAPYDYVESHRGLPSLSFTMTPKGNS